MADQSSPGIARRRLGRGPASRPESVPKVSRKTRQTRAGSAVLPSGRAALGALLCTLAALLTFVAYSHANRRPTARYVVAAHDLEPGAALGLDDLAYATAELPASLRSRTIADAADLIDATVLGPVGKGELLQLGNVIKKAGGPRTSEISFPIDAALAAAGRLRPGDRVAVLATIGSGSDTDTRVIANDVGVAHVDRPDTGLGPARSIVVTLSVDENLDTIELAQAVAVGKLMLVRTTGARPNTTTDATTATAATQIAAAPTPTAATPSTPSAPATPSTPSTPSTTAAAAR